MAGKRKKLAVKSKKVDWDKEVEAEPQGIDDGFVSEDARKYYGHLKTSNFIFERGFVLRVSGCTIRLIEEMEAQNWKVLCHHRAECIPTLVHEFYANARFSAEGESWVRGKKVVYSAEALNDYLECQIDGVDEFAEVKDTLDTEDFVKTLTLNGEFKYEGPQKTIIDSTCLNRRAKTWVLFVTASLIPTKHLNGISLENAQLIYCILKKKKVDVGKIISQQLFKRVRAAKGSFLWFPTLITGLCKFMGVSIRDEDTEIKVGHPITEVVIDRNIRVGGEASSKKRKEEQQSPAPGGTPMAKADDSGVVHTSINLEHYYINVKSSLDHIKAYQRQEHLKVDAELKFQRACLEALMKDRKLKLPLVKASPHQAKFDDEGYLVDSDGERWDYSEEEEASASDG